MADIKKNIDVSINVDAKDGTKQVNKYAKATEGAKRATKEWSEGLEIWNARANNARERSRDVGNEFDRLAKKARDAARGSREFGDKASGASTIVRGLADRIRIDAVGALQMFGRTAVDAAQKISELADESFNIQNTFANLPIRIDGARASTQGFVDDMTLAQAATRAVSFGVVETSEEFTTFSQAAAKLGQVAGVGMAKGIDDATTALARQSTAILDNLGITLKVEDARKQLAQQLGKNVSALTEEEKATAFAKIGMQKIAEAAQGLSLKTDGAAASVKRLGVELENVKIHALGGEQASVSLRSGIEQLDSQTRRLIDTSNVYGSDLRKVQAALREAGVSTEDLTDNYGKYQAVLAKVRQAEADRIRDLALSNQLTLEHMGLLNEVIERETSGGAKRALQQKRAELAYRETNKALAQLNTTVDGYIKLGETETDLQFLRQQLAFEQARGKDQAEINRLVLEELRLKEASLRAEAELADTSEKRLALLQRADDTASSAAIEMARQQGASQARKRGGHDNRSDFEKMLGLRAGAEASFDTGAQRDAEAQAAMAELFNKQSGAIDPFSPEEIERRHKAAIEAERSQNEMMLAEKLRFVELKKANGVDELTVIKDREDALISFHHEELRLMQESNASKAELLQKQNEIEQVMHEARIARIESAQAREAKRAKDFQKIAGTTIKATADMAGAFTKALFDQDKGIGESIKAFAKFGAEQLTVTAVTQGLQAAAYAIIPFTQPLAAQYAASAAAAAGGAALLGATYGIGQIGSDKGSKPSEPAKPSINSGGISGSGSSRGQSIPPPVSRPGTGAHSPPSQGGSSGGPVINIGTIQTLATSHEELGLNLAKIIKNSGTSLGSAA